MLAYAEHDNVVRNRSSPQVGSSECESLLTTYGFRFFDAHSIVSNRVGAMQVQDKLEKIGSASASRTATPRSSVDARSLQSLGKVSRTDSDPRLRPEDQFEILCNEAVLPLDMTLASVRQFVWRQSGELVMYYRRKRPIGHPQQRLSFVGSQLQLQQQVTPSPS
jgi:hypothetical protein